MKSIYLFFATVFIYSCSGSYNPEITKEDFQSHLDFMATDSLKGRYPGTLEDSILLDYIASEFSLYGLEAPGEDYIQHFQIVTGVYPDPSNKLQFGNIEFIQGEDYLPFGFSGNKNVTAPAVFAGYGFDIENDEKIERNDYKNIEPENKWVMILRGEPGNEEKYANYSSERDKAMLAMDKGAAGVIFISGETFSNHDELIDPDLEESAIDIPVLHLTRNAADQIFKEYGYQINGLEVQAKKDSSTLPFIESKEKLTANIKVNRKYETTGNVIGILPGNDPELREQYIIFGAHHDHLGMGGKGSSSRAPDTIAVHYGADDNASGTVSVLEMAAYYSRHSPPPSRSLVFVTFGAEEMGILGSRHFTENPVIDLNKISLMINLDMIGRMKSDSSLQIGGAGTARKLKEFIEETNDTFNLNLKIADAGYGPSDHASFYAKDIPVIFFSTGPHKDYHTPDDRIDSLNYKGMLLATNFIRAFANKIINHDSMLVFQEAGPKQGVSGRYMKGVTLGIMPDVSGAESEGGMEVLAVSEGKPADLGGMKKGDIIIAIENKPVKNVYDYMYRLKTLKAGQQVIVTVKRNQEVVELLIQL